VNTFISYPKNIKGSWEWKRLSWGTDKWRKSLLLFC